MSHYSNTLFPKGIVPNAQTVYHVGWESLPLTCPTPEMSLWNSHPQVYIPLHETGKYSCIYCGTTYILDDPAPGEPMPEFANTELEKSYFYRLEQIRSSTD